LFSLQNLLKIINITLSESHSVPPDSGRMGFPFLDLWLGFTIGRWVGPIITMKSMGIGYRVYPMALESMGFSLIPVEGGGTDLGLPSRVS